MTTLDAIGYLLVVGLIFLPVVLIVGYFAYEYFLDRSAFRKSLSEPSQDEVQPEIDTPRAPPADKPGRAA